MLGADGSLSIEPVEQVSKVVGVIESKVNLRYIVHQRWPVRDSIDNCPHVATRYFFHHVSHLRTAGPLDGKQRRAGMTVGFGHDASPCVGRERNTLSHRYVPIWD